MNVSTYGWLALFGFVAAMLILDLFLHRGHQEIKFKEAAIWSAIWVACGIAVGGVIWFYSGTDFALQYYSGYLIEKSLAIDNVFVWGLLFSALAVPTRFQHRVLFLGVLGALVMRGIMILMGAALIKEAAWTLYIFGAFLIFTAIKLVIETFHEGEEDRNEAGGMTKLISKLIPTTTEYHDNRYRIKQHGKWVYTPLLLVMLSIGFTDLLFALDSIPAVYGLTNEPYIVFVANAFALLGLRQLYFLLGGLMERLKYLSIGLSIILAWIGVKLVVHALHKNELPFINGGQHVEVIPEISTELSLAVIIITLVITTIWSLAVTGREAKKKA